MIFDVYTVLYLKQGPNIYKTCHVYDVGIHSLQIILDRQSYYSVPKFNLVFYIVDVVNKKRNINALNLLILLFYFQVSDDVGYVLYSALGSFYIPSCIMVFVYIRIYFAAKARARRGIKKKPLKSAQEQVFAYLFIFRPPSLVPIHNRWLRIGKGVDRERWLNPVKRIPKKTERVCASVEGWKGGR